MANSKQKKSKAVTRAKAPAPTKKTASAGKNGKHPSKPIAVKATKLVKQKKSPQKAPKKKSSGPAGNARPAKMIPKGNDTHSILNHKRPNAANEAKLNPFLKKQRDRLLQLRDGILDSMMGVAKDNLHSRAEGSEASAFGMHQADAGSDAYDRDFALSLLSQEQDALYEIEEALKRIDAGTYGNCEMSGKPIPHARLEAIPFARFTVDCQSQIERQHKFTRTRQPVTSLFGLTDEEGGDSEEEEPATESKE